MSKLVGAVIVATAAAMIAAAFLLPGPAMSASLCKFTMTQAIPQLEADGLAYEVTDDPAVIQEWARQAAVFAGVTVPAENMVRALRADGKGFVGVGFEGRDGCFTPRAIMFPAPTGV